MLQSGGVTIFDLSPLSGADEKNEWSCTSTPRHWPLMEVFVEDLKGLSRNITDVAVERYDVLRI
jgi:hypothetical protein